MPPLYAIVISVLTTTFEGLLQTKCVFIYIFCICKANISIGILFLPNCYQHWPQNSNISQSLVLKHVMVASQLFCVREIGRVEIRLVRPSDTKPQTQLG